MVGPIGVDLDNTIVSYDSILLRVASETGLLIRPENPQGKKAVRDAVRRLPDGEIKWQKLQAEIYGPRMTEADLIEGVDDFFTACRKRSIPLYIISHKTKVAHYDTTGTNLRLAALNWLGKRGFFNPDGIGLTRQQVFFESTRQAKIERIKALGCSHFIDDLEETFREEAFPSEVTKILLDLNHRYVPAPDVQICFSWADVTASLLGAGDG